MKRVEITNSLDGRKWKAELEDPTSWIAEMEAKALKGKGWGSGPNDYDIVITDITPEHNLKEALRKRRREYPGVHEIIHVICDHGIGSTEWDALMASRQATKLKYPKP